MTQIYYRGMLAGIHSWAIVGSRLIAALDRLGYNVAIQSSNGVAGLPPALQHLTGAIVEPTIGISYTIPPNIGKLSTSKLVHIYNYETTKLPPKWAHMMNHVPDLILPSSQFSYSIFAQNGVDRGKMAVLPHGFEPEIMTPQGEQYNIAANKFKILIVAAPHARKGFDVALQAIGEAFASTEDICVVIRTGLVTRKKNAYDVNIQELVEQVRQRVRLPEVRLITEELENVASLYRACNIMLSTSRTECFCLPLLEAAACKLPIITTGYGGQMDYLSQENSYPIRFQLTHALPAMQYWHYDQHAFLAEPDKEHIKQTLRYVYSHYDQAQQKAQKAYELVRNKYTWEHIAQKFVDIINMRSWDKQYYLTPSSKTEIAQRHEHGEQVYEALTAGQKEHIATAVMQDQNEIQQLEDTIEALQAQLQARKVDVVKKKNGSVDSSDKAVISIIIPVFNQVQYTRKCIESIRKFTSLPIEIIAIDNNSTDGTKDFLQAQDDIHVIANRHNMGFGKAINQGMVAATAPYLLWLNNDTEAQDAQWLTRLLGEINIAERIGAVGVAGGVLDEKFNFIKETRSASDDFSYLCGYCVLLKREVVQDVGLLDEDFGIAYYEDVDYSYRLREKQYELCVVPDVGLVHHGRVTATQAVPLHRLYRQNRTRFIAKWGQRLKQAQSDIRKTTPHVVATKTGRLSIAYVMMDVGLTGGSKIIFEHINALTAAGHTVNLYITGRYHASVSFPLNIKPVRIHKARLHEYLRYMDIAIATFWPTAYMIREAIRDLPKCKMVYMIQGFEPYFYRETQVQERAKASATYVMDCERIVVSTWLQQKLKAEFDVESELIVNTIDANVFKPTGTKASPKRALFLLRDESVLRGYEKAVALATILQRQLGMEIHVFGTTKPRNFPLRCQFHYRPYGYDLAQLYSSCYIYVETSKWQGFGLAPLEAMACGTPCVLSDSGGINEYAKHGRNSFIHAFDAPNAQYIQSVKKLLKDEALYQRMRQNAIETARRFDQDTINESADTNIVQKLEATFWRALS